MNEDDKWEKVTDPELIEYLEKTNLKRKDQLWLNGKLNTKSLLGQAVNLLQKTQ